MANAEQPAGAVRNGKIAIRYLNLRVRLTPQLPHRFDDLGHAAAIDRMVAAQAAAVGVELAALALLAEAEVFELHQHRDGEAVIDRGVFDVLWRDAGLFERARPRPHAGGIGQIELLAAARSLQRLAMTDHPHQWFLEGLRNCFRGHDETAAAIGDDAAIHPM